MLFTRGEASDRKLPTGDDVVVTISMTSPMSLARYTTLDARLRHEPRVTKAGNVQCDFGQPNVSVKVY